MNKEMLKKGAGRRFRFRPKATEFDDRGESVGERDDWWTVTRVMENGLELACLPLVFFLPYDHVVKFQSVPGWTDPRGTLVLGSAVQIRGKQVLLEPIHPNPRVPIPGPGPSVPYQIKQDLKGRITDSRRTRGEDEVNQEDPVGGQDYVGWRCSRGTRNELEQQRCGCGCGTLMVEGTMIFRDEQTGEEYEGAPRG